VAIAPWIGGIGGMWVMPIAIDVRIIAVITNVALRISAGYGRDE
jgi:hypothetical protein